LVFQTIHNLQLSLSGQHLSQTLPKGIILALLVLRTGHANKNNSVEEIHSFRIAVQISVINFIPV